MFNIHNSHGRLQGLLEGSSNPSCIQEQYVTLLGGGSQGEERAAGVKSEVTGPGGRRGAHCVMEG